MWVISSKILYRGKSRTLTLRVAPMATRTAREVIDLGPCTMVCLLLCVWRKRPCPTVPQLCGTPLLKLLYQSHHGTPIGVFVCDVLNFAQQAPSSKQGGRHV